VAVFEHCARDSKLRVKVPKTRTNCSSRSSGTATYIWLSPTSIPAALRLICLRASRRTILLPGIFFFSHWRTPYLMRERKHDALQPTGLSVWNSSKRGLCHQYKNRKQSGPANLRALGQSANAGFGHHSEEHRVCFLLLVIRYKEFLLNKNRAKPDGPPNQALPEGIPLGQADGMSVVTI